MTDLAGWETKITKMERKKRTKQQQLCHTSVTHQNTVTYIMYDCPKQGNTSKETKNNSGCTEHIFKR